MESNRLFERSELRLAFSTNKKLKINLFLSINAIYSIFNRT